MIIPGLTCTIAFSCHAIKIILPHGFGGYLSARFDAIADRSECDEPALLHGLSGTMHDVMSAPSGCFEP